LFSLTFFGILKVFGCSNVFTAELFKNMHKKTFSEEHSYVVIMAGGSGTRLWPVSRKEKPKQFQRFLSSKTMLEETYDRVAKLVPVERIFVSTTYEYRDLVLETLPALTAERIIAEPSPRGTAAAIALVARHIARTDPEAVVATIASDHAIKNPGEFVEALSAAFYAAEKYPDKLVTIGINPTRPDTGLGYIKMGEEMDKLGEKRIFFIDAFKEKPDHKTAEEYLVQWEYLWNAGYFIFSAANFLRWVEKLAPQITQVLSQIDEAKQRGASDGDLAQLYNTIDNEPIDTLIVERLPKENRLVVPSALEWSDVGNWSTLFDFLSGHYNSSLVVKGNHVDVGSQNCFVHSDKKLVATLGLKDLIIIETEDAIFVADKEKSPEVKQLIDKLKSEGKHVYL
jgi:mannose-1-phosphate guanylyltransferase